MSDKESEDGRDKEEEEEDEEPLKYAPAISALPPRVIQQEESQVEVSASPAFQCLEEVGTTMCWMKSVFFMYIMLLLYIIIYCNICKNCYIVFDKFLLFTVNAF